ncbi:MAG: MFS transporter, partial [Candidatus Puniceispirillaceae bacterium]
MANHPIEADFSDKHRQKVIIIAALVSAIGFIDATALNVALPFIQESLNASATDIHWVLEIYLLFLAALLMAGGALGDTLGRRRPLRWGVGLFALTSLGCALSPSAEWLIFFRALQGISAALMIPASLALINAGFAPEARGAAIGKWSAIVALAIPIGPLIGGLAVDFLSWHFVFLLNLPIAGLVLVMLA